MGADRWIEEQLAPEQIDDTACDLRARRFETIWHDPGTCYEYKKPVLREEITRHTLLRGVYSQRQLFEVMVGFWTDHLNIDLEKGDCIYLKPSDDRLVIRAHALGKFKELIRASATSPAMLVYLDGKENKKDIQTMCRTRTTRASYLSCIRWEWTVATPSRMCTKLRDA